ncbi:MAG: HEAT repeat domain-containing protein [Deltaproteobacteria bacterium]|nr:HEAT repeat domain-containing protein [Deltaproteobacteria bacterium]
MKAEEAEFTISKIASAAHRAGDSGQKLALLGKQILDFSPDDQALLMSTIGARATEDPACGRLLLLLADVAGFKNAVGSDKFDKLRQNLAGRPQGAAVDRYFRAVSALDADRLLLFRAKSAIMLQTLSMLNDRLEQERVGLIKVNGYDVAERVMTESGLEDNTIRIDLSNWVGKQALPTARDVLLEADFEEVDDETFQSNMNEEQVRILGQASGLGVMLGTGGAAKLSEAVAQRQALFIVKRFCLLVRSATMYPPDHPGLPPAFEALKSTVDSAIEDKEQVTITVIGGDILLDDFKIRKEDRFKKTFCDLFDERQVSSVTFRQGLTPDEVKFFTYCFTESPKMIKDKGGVRKILQRKNITNIVVDQFKYGVVADDGKAQVEGHAVASDDHLLESLIYNQVLEKLEKGGNIQSLSIEEVGSFFRDILANPDEDKRKALARMLITLDPGLLEKGFLSSPEMRRNLSWSAARKTLDHMFRELGIGDHESKEQALETIAQLTDLAITRNKEQTVASITKRMIDYIANQETDPDLLRMATRVYSTMAITYLRRRKMEQGKDFLDILSQLAQGEGEIRLGQDEKSPSVYISLDDRSEVPIIAREALRSIGQEDDVVDILVAGAIDAETSRSQPASEMLEAIETDLVVNKLFRVFVDPDRAVRARAYQILKRLGKRSLRSIRVAIDERKAVTCAGRDPSSGIFQQESDWYILRNCVGLLTEIDVSVAEPYLTELTGDRDHRVRKEALQLLVRSGLPSAPLLTKRALKDPKAEVRDAAIFGLGVFRDDEAVETLIDLFLRYEQHRKAVLEAMERIATPSATRFLLKSLEAIDSSTSRKRKTDFPVERDAILGAIATLGAIGGPEAIEALDEFVERWSSPLKRFFFRPVKGMMSFQDLLNAARNALTLARRRAGSRTGTVTVAPRQASAAPA